MAELTSTSDSKFKLGDLVWAKVKGFNYWPAKIVQKDDLKCNRKIKNPKCVFFYGSNNWAIVSEDQIRPYEEYREQFSNIPKKSQGFRQAIEKIEEELANKSKGTSGSFATTNVSSTTPDTNKSDTVFKTKKVASPVTPTPPLTRDYSRTPFKREKRTFDNSTDDVKKPTPTVKQQVASSSTAVDEKQKRLKLASSTPIMPSFKQYSPAKVQLNLDGKREPEKVSELKTINKSSKSKPSSLKFGFIGLGKMGQHMVRLLLNFGHEVTIWNRTPSKCKDFEKLGASIVKTPGDVVRESDITFSCLSDATASQNIFFGNCGVASEINATKGYVELTSIDYITSMEIESAIKSKGGRYLEAPVLICSLPEQIEEGKLVAMVSGNRSLFDDCSTSFEAICSHVYFLSETAGTASKMNTLFSTFFANIVGSLLECMTLVERLGLLHKDFIEIISHSPMNSQWIQSKIPSLIDSTLIREIPIDHLRKDLAYCLHNANQKSLTTPITASVNEMFKQKKHHYY